MNNSITAQQTMLFGIRLKAVVEAIIGLVILLALDMTLGDGNRFWSLNPHPYWIVVLLVACKYGVGEGLVSALLATAFLLIGNMPEPSDAERFTKIYDIAINPVLWIAAALFLGGLRDIHLRERNELVKELDDSRERETLISDSYKFVRGRKEALEVQVSGQLASSIEAYRSAKAVEALDPKSVMQGVESLVSSILGPQKFSLYLFHDNKLTSTIIHGWAADDKYAQELDSFSPLYQAVVGQRELLVIANEQHELSLDGQGIIAGPILDPDTNRVIGMLKIEQMEFTSLSLNTVETFRAISEWIGTALINARNYQTVKSDAMTNPDRGILSYNYFKRQSDYMTKLAKRINFHLTMMVIKLNDAKTLNDADRITIARQIGESVKSVLRSVDLAFDYQTDGEEFSILLPSTNAEGANIVREKIARDMEKALRGKSVSFNYIVSVLHATR